MLWSRLIENCTNAIQSFNNSKEGAQGELFSLCSQGLHALVTHPERYRDNIVIAQKFLPELEKATGAICTDTCQDPQAEGFVILETLALIMREASLRLGAVCTQTEAALLAYFEKNDNWQVANGTEVTDFYYNRIPIAVLHNLNEKMRNTLTISE